LVFAAFFFGHFAIRCMPLPFAICYWPFTTRALLSAFGRLPAILLFIKRHLPFAICHSLLAVCLAHPANGLFAAAFANFLGLPFATCNTSSYPNQANLALFRALHPQLCHHPANIHSQLRAPCCATWVHANGRAINVLRLPGYNNKPFFG